MTKSNTGLTIKRNKTKFTASWKIRAKDVEKQYIQARIKGAKKWGKWTAEKSISKSATSWTFKVDLTAHPHVTKVQIRVRVKAKKEKVSGWTTETYVIEAPDTPTLSVSSSAPNQSTFTITPKKSDTSHKWYIKCEATTKLGVKATDAGSSWATTTLARSFTEQTYNKYRVLKVRAVGPAGNSKGTATKAHYVGRAPRANIKSVTATAYASYYALAYKAEIDANAVRVDEIVPQYIITSPDANFQPPDSGWSDGASFKYRKSGTYNLFANTDSLIGMDQCLWARIKTTHDGVENYSLPKLVRKGKLTAPTGNISVTIGTGFDVDISDFSVETSAPCDTYVYYAVASDASKKIKIGKYEGQTLHCNRDISQEAGYAIYVQNQLSSMVSDYLTYETQMPSAPTITAIEQTGDKKVYIDWSNTWAQANGAIIAWTDDPDNWMSNEEPKTYEVKDRQTEWYITDLNAGTWYFRVKSTRTVGDAVTESPWSEDYIVTVSETPPVPVLYLSADVILPGEPVMATWARPGAEVWEVEIVENQQSITINEVAKIAESDGTSAELVFDTARNINLALKSKSATGVSSLSDPVSLVVSAPPTLAVDTNLSDTLTLAETFIGGQSTYTVGHTISTLLSVTVDGVSTTATYDGDEVTVTAPDDSEVVITYETEDIKVMTDFPLNVVYYASGATDVVTTITRTESHPMIYPDGREELNPKGEAVYIGEDQEITRNLLMKDLEDGGLYTITVKATNDYGQEAIWTLDFIVSWTHQAWEPSGVVVTDDLICKITPIASASFEQGDACDIYRLSKDGAELIVPQGAFGTTYVDPYPAFGEQSGYRLVTVTNDGDYITPENTFADFEPEYEKLDPGMLVINYHGREIRLPYDLTVGTQWQKDFKRTTYLDGRVVGDYNPGIQQDVSINTVLVRNINEEIVAQMHDLGAYPGRCHVRTPDGMSFEADVSVQEDRAHNDGKVSYGLTIQKVDTNGYDGMTLSEWEDINGLE